MKSFDGEMKGYENWRRRIRDHFIGTNIHYKEIFDIAEAEKHAIPWDGLPTTFIASRPNLCWQWIAL